MNKKRSNPETILIGYMQTVNIAFIFKAATKYSNVANYKMYASYEYDHSYVL